MIGVPYRVFIPARPTGDPYDLVRPDDLERARVIRADEVQRGDLILADFPDFDRPATGLVHAEHFTDPYWAAPSPVEPDCGCLCCQGCAWTAADGPLVKLNDGFPWDGCTIFRATDLLLVARYQCACGCDPTLADDGAYDWTSPASVQHLLETGRPLRPGETLACPTN